jgi:hypothetical protein
MRAKELKRYPKVDFARPPYYVEQVDIWGFPFRARFLCWARNAPVRRIEAALDSSIETTNKSKERKDEFSDVLVSLSHVLCLLYSLTVHAPLLRYARTLVFSFPLT